MDTSLLGYLVIFGAICALAFDIINGFHDAANAIATIVSTRVLSPRLAVVWAAGFNFAALFLFTPRVAHTISTFIHLPPHDPRVVVIIVAALLGAIGWNLITWVWGLPTSSSHALVGALAGAGLAVGGPGAVSLGHLTQSIAFIPLAPLLAFVLGSLLMVALAWLFRSYRPRQVDGLFRRLQLLSAASYSLGHGGNDAQKTAGILLVLGIAGGYVAVEDHGAGQVVPWSLLAMCNGAMALGTSFGGWRIVKTMGSKITRLRPHSGFCAELAGALTLFGCTHVGIPVSTTHTITGAIIGVGSVRRARSIQWGIASRIVWAWLLTMPAAALLAAAIALVLRAVLPLIAL